VKNVLNPMPPVKEAEQVRRANVIVRGLWVNYLRVGNSSAVFDEIRRHAEVRVRRVLQRKASGTGVVGSVTITSSSSAWPLRRLLGALTAVVVLISHRRAV
jgi:hypothetical protein